MTDTIMGSTIMGDSLLGENETIAADAAPAAEVEQPADNWAIVEIMGHRKHIGRVRNVQKYGAGMLEVNVPNRDGSVKSTHYYGGAAIFAVTPISEAQALATLKRDWDYDDQVAQRRLAPPTSDDDSGDDDDDRADGHF